jgi:hypothetical protein
MRDFTLNFQGTQMLRFLLVATTFMFATACSTQPKVIAPKPVIKSIAIIPATSPANYTLENVSAVQFLIPLAATVNYLDSKQKAKAFNEKLAARPPSLGPSFTEEVARSLRLLGYEVQILEGVLRPPGDLDNVDYAKVVTTADAVLHVQFTQVGLFSPRSSANYIPRVNAYGTMFVKGRTDYLYDQQVYYGVDATSSALWSIPSDPKFAYTSFDSVLSNIDEVQNAFQIGAQAIGKRIAEQVHESIK